MAAEVQAEVEGVSSIEDPMKVRLITPTGITLDLMVPNTQEAFEETDEFIPYIQHYLAAAMEAVIAAANGGEQ